MCKLGRFPERPGGLHSFCMTLTMDLVLYSVWFSLLLYVSAENKSPTKLQS